MARAEAVSARGSCASRQSRAVMALVPSSGVEAWASRPVQVIFTPPSMSTTSISVPVTQPVATAKGVVAQLVSL